MSLPACRPTGRRHFLHCSSGVDGSRREDTVHREGLDRAGREPFPRDWPCTRRFLRANGRRRAFENGCDLWRREALGELVQHVVEYVNSLGGLPSGGAHRRAPVPARMVGAENQAERIRPKTGVSSNSGEPSPLSQANRCQRAPKLPECHAGEVVVLKGHLGDIQTGPRYGARQYRRTKIQASETELSAGRERQ